MKVDVLLLPIFFLSQKIMVTCYLSVWTQNTKITFCYCFCAKWNLFIYFLIKSSGVSEWFFWYYIENSWLICDYVKIQFRKYVVKTNNLINKSKTSYAYNTLNTCKIKK